MTQILKKDEGVLVTLEGRIVRKTVYGLNCSKLSRRVTPEEMVDREIRALQLLEGFQGVQRFVRRESADTFYSDYIEGNSLLASPRDMSKTYFDKLMEIVRQCQDRGVYRLDQSRADFIVSPEGNPGIIDFGNIIFLDDFVARVPGVVYLAKMYNLLRVWDLQRRYVSSNGHHP